MSILFPTKKKSNKLLFSWWTSRDREVSLTSLSLTKREKEICLNKNLFFWYKDMCFFP